LLDCSAKRRIGGAISRGKTFVFSLLVSVMVIFSLLLRGGAAGHVAV
jgi:hypothetical protein